MGFEDGRIRMILWIGEWKLEIVRMGFEDGRIN